MSGPPTCQHKGLDLILASSLSPTSHKKRQSFFPTHPLCICLLQVWAWLTLTITAVCLQPHALSSMLLQMVSMILLKCEEYAATTLLKIISILPYSQQEVQISYHDWTSLSLPFGPHFHPRVPWVPLILNSLVSQPSSFIPACFWMRLSFSSKFLFLFAQREDSYRFSGASLRRSACLSGHHPFPEGDWELSHLCSQILKSQITQFTIGLPHQSPWRQAPGPRHLGQYLAPGRIRGVQLPQRTLS